MKQFMAPLGNILFVIYLLFSISITSSCKSQSQSDYFFIKKEPVFFEVDTSVSSTGRTILSRYDYFLVKGNFETKEDIKKAVDSFAIKNSNKETMHYDDYLMFFYKESSAVNEKEIQNRESEYRYRIFENNKENDFIVCYIYRDSRLSNVDRGNKYK